MFYSHNGGALRAATSPASPPHAIEALNAMADEPVLYCLRVDTDRGELPEYFTLFN